MKLRPSLLTVLVMIAFGAARADAQGRLFAASWIAPQAPTGERYARGAAPEGPGIGGDIYELDPSTGAILNSFPPPVISYSGEQGLAFDGTSLWYLSVQGFGEGIQVTLYELDPDTGAVIDSDPLANVYSADGLGSLGGLIYVLDWDSDIIRIFNPAIDAIDGSIDIGAANPLRNFEGGLDGWIDGNALLVTADPLAGAVEGAGPTHLLCVLDPVTGAELDSFPLGGEFDAGVAALGSYFYTGEHFGATNIEVYDSSGALIDTFPTAFLIGALAAGGSAPPPLVGVPAITPLGAGALALVLAAAAIVVLRRRQAVIGS